MTNEIKIIKKIMTEKPLSEKIQRVVYKDMKINGFDNLGEGWKGVGLSVSDVAEAVERFLEDEEMNQILDVKDMVAVLKASKRHFGDFSKEQEVGK